MKGERFTIGCSIAVECCSISTSTAGSGWKLRADKPSISGYGYVISNVGIIGFVALWALFMSLQGSNRFFYSFRNVTALYFTTLLCISSSQFTIKIAALLWFLLGVLSVVKTRRQS